MKRDLQFKSGGKLCEALGVSPERIKFFDDEVGHMIAANYNKEQIITKLNERGDMTDAEWTSVIFALGYFEGSLGT